jgi:hypothetical protein
VSIEKRRVMACVRETSSVEYVVMCLGRVGTQHPPLPSPLGTAPRTRCTSTPSSEEALSTWSREDQRLLFCLPLPSHIITILPHMPLHSSTRRRASSLPSGGSSVKRKRYILLSLLTFYSILYF